MESPTPSLIPPTGSIPFLLLLTRRKGNGNPTTLIPSHPVSHTGQPSQASPRLSTGPLCLVLSWPELGTRNSRRSPSTTCLHPNRPIHPVKIFPFLTYTLLKENAMPFPYHRRTVVIDIQIVELIFTLFREAVYLSSPPPTPETSLASLSGDP